MPYLITKISQAVKNPDRVNIYINNQFWVGLGKNDLITLKLVSGRELTELEKQEIESASSKGKVIERAMRFALLRPRSCAEVKDYLVHRNKIEEEEADSVITYLQDREILSDEKFAQWYLDYKLSSGVNGINKIKTELLKKKVSMQIITALLEKLNTNEEFQNEQHIKIKEFADKIIKTIKARNNYELKSKLVQRLMARGFKYNDIKEVLKSTPGLL